MTDHRGGFNQRPLDVINRLLDLLKNMYPDYGAVIKEIIQNADDAKATEIHIGIIPGLDVTENPLLKGPLVFFMNDGDFTDANVDAICSFGIGDNANRKDTIGQFGLGLKSVFHLGEAFYVLSSTQEPIVLNPWHGAKVHNENIYDVYTTLSGGDVVEFKKRLPLYEMPFCLLVPLRVEKIIGSRKPIVNEFFDGADLDAIFNKLFPPEIQRRLARILPILRRLETIALYKWDGCSTEACRITFGDGRKERCRYPEQVKSGKIEGSILYAGNKSTYAGIEVDVNALAPCVSEKFSNLKKSGHWPKVFTIGNDDQPVAADPHGMVCLQRFPENSGRKEFRIGWSVFLPVAEAETLPLVLDGTNDSFSLTLHGYFFVDSGRREIPGINDENDGLEISNTASLQRYWNTRLRDHVVLPLIPQAFCAFDESCEPAIMAAVVKTFERTQLFKRWRKDICGRYQWVRRITPKAQAVWELVESSKSLIRLPGVNEKGLEALFETLPGIHELVTNRVVVTGDAPLISRQSAHDPDDDAVAGLVESVDAESITRGRKQLECLYQALGGLCTGSHSQQALINLMRRIFAGTPISQLRNHTTKLKEMLALISKGVLYLKSPDLNAPKAEEMFKRLNERTIGVGFIVVPAHFRRMDIGNPALEYQHPENAVPHLVDLSEDADLRSNCADMVLELLERLDAGHTRDLVLQQCGDVALFSVSRPGTTEPIYHTLNSLHTAKTEERLFKRSDVLESMQKAIAGVELLCIKEVHARVLFGQDGVPTGNMDACVEYLEKHLPPLAPRQDRIPFLKKMLEQPNQRVNAIRYVLHGNRNAFDDGGALFLSVQGNTGIWTRLINSVLQQSAEHWRPIDASLADNIAPAHYDLLGIKSFSKAEVLDYLVSQPEAILEAIDFSGYNEEERYEIAGEINRPEHPVLKKCLRLHQTACGAMIPQCEKYGERRVYLERATIPVPDSLRSQIYLVQVIPTHQDLQEEIFIPFNAKALISLIGEQEAPHEYWRDILAIPGQSHSNESRSQLQDMPWLPTGDNAGVPPSRILYYPALSEHISAVLTDGHYEEDYIRSDVRAHDRFSFVRELYRQPEKMFHELKALFSESEEYALGISCVLSDVETVEGLFDSFMDIFSGTDEDLMPAVDLLQTLKHNGDNQFAKELFVVLSEISPGADRLVAILEYLRTVPGETCFKWHIRYLKIVNAQRSVEQVVGKINLRSRTGAWKPCSQLCHGLDNISRTSLVNEEQAGALNLPISTVSIGENDAVGDVGVASDGNTLLEYFKPWYELISEKQIGFFLSFFSSDEAVRSTVEHLLYPHTLKNIWNRVDWHEALGPGEGATFDVAQAVESVQWRFKVSAEINIAVTALTGTFITVPVNEVVQELLLGPPKTTMKQPYTIFHLRSFNPGDISAEQRKEFLVTALVKVFQHTFKRNTPNETEFTKAFDALARTEQLTLAVTQKMLKKALPFYISQLGVMQECSQIIECLESYDAQCRSNAEQEASGGEDEETAVERLVELIQTNNDVAQTLLGGVRQKMKVNQYEPSSIPFELFQNADDAVVQWRELVREGSEEPSSSPFVIQHAGNTLYIMHWGRPINRHSFRGGNSRNAYKKDLENMLTLNTSNKGNTDACEISVGKFGLGFKSVFLVSNLPKVLSGDLCFKIVGGLWPMQCDEREQLNGLLHAHEPENTPPGTIIVLPEVGNADLVLERFRSLCSLLCVTGQGIQKISIINGDETSEHFSWKPKRLSMDDRIEYGVLSRCEEANLPKHALKVRMSEGALILGMDEQGPRPFSKEVPTIWSLAPTREYTSLGLILNVRNLPLDVGRSQIGNVTEEMITEFSDELTKRFSSIAEYVCRDWEEARREWQLDGGLSAYDFWLNFFEYLVAPYEKEEHDNKAYSMVKQILWNSEDKGGGLANIMREYAIVPTGLWDPYKRVSRLDQITGYLKKTLCREPIFNNLLLWPIFQSHIQPGSMVSEEIFRCLKRVGAVNGDLHEYDVLDLLQGCVQEGDKVSPKQAAFYGTIVNKDMLSDMEQRNNENFTELREFLQTLKFVNADGTYTSSVNLLCKHQRHESINDDEPRRAAFAPSKNILHPDYVDDALEFFMVCRKEMSANAEVLGGWLISLDKDPQRVSALNYVLTGDLGRQVAEKVVGKGIDNTWVSNLQESHVLDDFDGYQRNRLFAAFNLFPSQSFLPPSPSRNLDAATVLTAIWEWWYSHHPQEIENYERTIYPDFVREDGLLSRLDTGDREAWMTLFLLGACHTMGRTTYAQHKGFLELCKSNGWLDTFTDPKAQPEQWIEILEAHIDLQWRTNVDTFAEWMKLFPSIYRLARWLDEYIDAFEAGSRSRNPIRSLSDLTAPTNAAVHQGGGPDAPSISGVLGIGTCFVVRELVRHSNKPVSPHLFPHCFVPTKRIREFFADGLSCANVNVGSATVDTSKAIYEFLCGHLGESVAVFNNAFDIPFNMLLKNSTLQQELLGRVWL